MKFQCQTCAYIYEGDSVPEKCPVCHNNSFMEYDYAVLKDLKCSPELINAMQNLKKSDIIEYELKMSQFRNQLEQKESIEREIRRKQQDEASKPKCPKCGSTNITTGQRGFSLLTGFWGSNKTVNRCANCGHTWKP